MKDLFFTIFSVILSACASDPYFKSYEDEFYAEARRRKVPTTATVIAFEEPALTLYGQRPLGDCFYRDELPNVIRIDIHYWRSLTEKCRKALLWHELGHCALNRDHTKTGIMRPTLDCNASLKGVWKR